MGTIWVADKRLGLQPGQQRSKSLGVSLRVVWCSRNILINPSMDEEEEERQTVSWKDHIGGRAAMAEGERAGGRRRDAM